MRTRPSPSDPAWPQARATPPGYRRLAWGAVVLTIALIGLGSFVRVSESGLGCPDWPLCHGQLLPPAERTAIIEWAHRSVATLTGLVITASVVWALAIFRADRLRLILAGLVLPLLGMQALLGREAVLRELPPIVVATHMLMAMTLLALLVVLAASRAPSDAALDGAASTNSTLAHVGSLRAPVWIALLATGSAVALGAVMVSAGGAYSCTTWPGCTEAPIPWLRGDTVHHLQWIHRFTTLLAASALGYLVLRAHRVQGLRHDAYCIGLFVLGLFALQALIGAMNVFWGLSSTRVTHLVLAAIIWAIVVELAVREANRGHASSSHSHAEVHRPSEADPSVSSLPSPSN